LEKRGNSEGAHQGQNWVKPKRASKPKLRKKKEGSNENGGKLMGERGPQCRKRFVTKFWGLLKESKNIVE